MKARRNFVLLTSAKRKRKTLREKEKRCAMCIYVLIVR
jgi:hypothetical protein